MTAPLTRDHMTRSLRIMVWVYPTFGLVYGYLLFTTPQRELKVSEAFVFADRFMDLGLWGILYLVVGIVQVGLLLTGRRAGYVLALSVFFIGMAIWTVVFAGAVVHTGAVPMAPMWPAFLCISTVAAMKSLVAQETGRAR